MRLLIAGAAVVAAFAAPAAMAGPAEYERPCGGILDAECRGTTCPMDCFTNDCLVWLDPLHSPFSALCV